MIKLGTNFVSHIKTKTKMKYTYIIFNSFIASGYYISSYYIYLKKKINSAIFDKILGFTLVS